MQSDGNICFRYKFGYQMAPLALVAKLSTRWRHLHWLQILPPDGTTCIGCKFGHQMAPLGLVPNLVTRWRHLHWLQIWPPDGTTCITCITCLPLSGSLNLSPAGFAQKALAWLTRPLLGSERRSCASALQHFILD